MAKNIRYSEPAEYFPAEIRKKILEEGKKQDAEKKTEKKKTPAKKTK